MYTIDVKRGGCLARIVVIKPKERFGRLVALRPQRVKGRLGWLCRCDCGTTKAIPSISLKQKRKPVRSCGCSQHHVPGLAFGHLKLIKKVGRTTYGRTRKRHSAIWEAECDCSNRVRVPSFRLNDHSSCGCKYTRQRKVTKVRRGRRFGLLKAVTGVTTPGPTGRLIECRCDCGATRVALVSYLIRGLIISCGCAPKRPELLKPKTCQLCSKPFMGKGRQRFCSKQCSNNFITLRRHVARGLRCRSCDEPLPLGRRLYCSHQCNLVAIRLNKEHVAAAKLSTLLKERLEHDRIVDRTDNS